VIATLAVIVPTGRFGPAEQTLCAAALTGTADSLSAFLGYAGVDHRA